MHVVSWVYFSHLVRKNSLVSQIQKLHSSVQSAGIVLAAITPSHGNFGVKLRATKNEIIGVS